MLVLTRQRNEERRTEGINIKTKIILCVWNRPILPAQQFVDGFRGLANAIAQHHSARTVREQARAYPRLLRLIDAVQLAPRQRGAHLERNTQHSRRLTPGSMAERKVRTRTQRSKAPAAAHAMEKYPFYIVRNAEFLGDVVVEARVRAVGTCGGDDVGDVSQVDACFGDGAARGSHGEWNAIGHEDAVDVCDGGSGSMVDDWVFGRANGGTGVDACVLVHREHLFHAMRSVACSRIIFREWELTLVTRGRISPPES